MMAVNFSLVNACTEEFMRNSYQEHIPNGGGGVLASFVYFLWEFFRIFLWDDSNIWPSVLHEHCDDGLYFR